MNKKTVSWVTEAILNIVEHNLVTPERLEQLLRTRALDLLCNPRATIDISALQHALGVVPIEFEFTVNHALPVEQMVRGAKLGASYTPERVGEYYVRIPETERTDIQLLHADVYDFPQGTKLEDTSRILAREGKRHATAHELLAFAREFPHVQEQCECIGAGTLLTGIVHEIDKRRGTVTDPCEKTGYLTLYRCDLSTHGYERRVRRSLTVTTLKWLAPDHISSKKFLIIKTR